MRISSEIVRVAVSTFSGLVEDSNRATVMRGCDEPPESLAQGTLSKGFPRNLGELLVSCRMQQVLDIEGNRDGAEG